MIHLGKEINGNLVWHQEHFALTQEEFIELKEIVGEDLVSLKQLIQDEDVAYLESERSELKQELLQILTGKNLPLIEKILTFVDFLYSKIRTFIPFGVTKTIGLKRKPSELIRRITRAIIPMLPFGRTAHSQPLRTIEKKEEIQYAEKKRKE